MQTEKELKEETNIEFHSPARPLLKWAGGKAQLLNELLPHIPQSYGRYIEPFFGGGALFFAIAPSRAIISDSNAEIINLYKVVAENVEGVIVKLLNYKNAEKEFYSVRAQSWADLSPTEAAARTIFLNKTCFNGLHRVNQQGQFNVPFGSYSNPRILDVENLRAASCLLRKAEILCGDYKKVLRTHAQAGDFIFLDPPYLPISQYSDFKRYTKEQFHEEDHMELAVEVKRLAMLGCHVILTNSNHPLVHELYNEFKLKVIQTKRYISSDGKKRVGEDVIVLAPPSAPIKIQTVSKPLPKQVDSYPSTRYMGSKAKLLNQIWAVASNFNFDTVIDLFSGSGIVGYMFKACGKKVISNDYMAMSATFSKAMIENNDVTVSKKEVEKLFRNNKKNNCFVETTFRDLYFSDADNRFIDILRTNIKKIRNPYKRAIAMSALMRACLKKRPRGIFTYVGQRYDDGRKDLQMSFRDQFLDAVNQVNSAVFDNGLKNVSRNGEAMTLECGEPCLVYIDPPYYSPFSDNEYVRRYHFIEGLARDWHGVEIQQHTATKKFKSYPTPFSSRKGAAEAFDLLFKRFKRNILLVSYSSNSQPNLDEMVAIMAKYKPHVEVVPVKYQYSFGNQGHKVRDNRNNVHEYLFVGF